MDLVTGDKCDICGAAFPASWKRPIRCHHRHPERDWRHRPLTSVASKPAASYWSPLHRYPVEHWATWDPLAAARWFAAWRAGIPNYGCSCRQNFTAYLASHPPSYSSPDAFFAWTVQAHNHVSLHHVQPPKPLLALDDARQLYGLPAVISDSPAGLHTPPT